MTFDPIADKRNQKYTREELTSFFKGSAAVAQRLKKENPAKYQELRRSAEQMGIVGPSLIGTPAPNTPYRQPAKTYTPEELKLRGEFTETYCRELFASGDAKAARELHETNREGYENAKDAAISFGILPARTTPRPQPAPVAAPEPLHRISPELADESGLPRDVLLPWAQVELLCEQKVARARKAQADADTKADADRQAELAKLTSRQQADQAERDRKQADLDRLQELITPKPVVTPEPVQLATARAIAAEKAVAA
jgi:hypothetical protein